MECRGFRPVHYLCRVYSGRIKQDGNAYGDRVPEQMNNGEWDGDFARDMLLSWYGKQGVQLDSNGDTTNGKDLDFSTWAQFKSYADDIERLVFDEGRMPLGLLIYQTFWADPQKAELLAGFIAPHVTKPGGFEARRTAGSGNIIPPGRVVARAGPDRVTTPVAPITLDAAASLFADITAVFDAECIFCHEVGGSEPGIPVWWTTNQPSAAGMPVPSLYEQAMTRVIPRVIPEYIEDSLWLKKPSGQHHNGNRTSGLNTSVSAGAMERASYDMYVNWIAEGAVCRMVGPECPWTPDVGFKYA